MLQKQIIQTIFFCYPSKTESCEIFFGWKIICLKIKELFDFQKYVYDVRLNGVG